MVFNMYGPCIGVMQLDEYHMSLQQAEQVALHETVHIELHRPYVHHDTPNQHTDITCSTAASTSEQVLMRILLRPLQANTIMALTLVVLYKAKRTIRHCQCCQR